MVLAAPLIAQDARVSIHVDAGRRAGPMTTMWAFFGYDEPNYTYMKDGRKLLSELARDYGLGGEAGQQRAGGL